MFGRRKTTESAVAIIPARLGSTRFPAKALASETGKPLVVHVCERAAQADSVGRVVVATDAIEIKEAVEAHGFEAVMTGEHPNGTCRIADAAAQLGLHKTQVIVNVQGDEPEIEPDVIEGAVIALGARTVINTTGDHTPGAGERYQWVGTVATPIEEASNPNEVKVVLNRFDPETTAADALYFSRAAIPFDRDGDTKVQRYRHVGIYAYTVSALERYIELEETPLERAERLEQLRWLEHGYPISVAVRESSHSGIDTPEQYAAFVERSRSLGS